jgi:dUTP pyrophosphatase
MSKKLDIKQITTSSNVFKIAHDGEDLIVDMKGGTYRYKNVSSYHFNMMANAESAGKYLNEHIKDHHEYAKEDLAIDTLATLGTATATDISPVTEALDNINNTIVQEQMKQLIKPHFNNWGLQPMKIQVIDPKISIQYAKPGDAAFDLQACITEPKTVYPGERVLFKAGFAIALSPGLCGLVIPRSGGALKKGVSVVNSPGLIDSGYRGEVGVIYENRGQDPVTVEPYERIAQFLITPAITPIFILVDTLDETERGATGFGSSGTEAKASPLQPRTKSA